MIQTTFQKLEQERVKWKPQPLKQTPYGIAAESNIGEFVEKSIALGLILELPVGIWANESRKQLKNAEQKIADDALFTLGKNIQDETVHFKAFQYAETAYPVRESIYNEAKNIGNTWEAHKENPLMLAALAETAIFLPSLAILRLYGGDSLGTLANDVSRDEYRHVATNKAILRLSGTPLESTKGSSKTLQEETLRWLLGNFNNDELGIDFDWINEQSNLLLYEGVAEELEELTVNAEYKPPFEHSNKYSY